MEHVRVVEVHVAQHAIGVGRQPGEVSLRHRPQGLGHAWLRQLVSQEVLDGDDLRRLHLANLVLQIGKRDANGRRPKDVVELGELATLDNVRRASWLALLAGGDFIKTSTGKISPAATPPVSLVMLQAVRDFRARTGSLRGVKLAGGIRTTKEAVRYLVMVNETAGEEWLTPDLFRFGASSLLNDLLQQRHKLSTGAYDGPDYVTVD